MASSSSNATGNERLNFTRTPSAIAAELRRGFEAAFQQVYGSRPERDPMMAVLLQALATQVSRVYEDATQLFPERVIDDLIASLGVSPSVAVPAQTVVVFREVESREAVQLDVPLVGYSRSGDEMQFLPDRSIDLLPAVLRFTGVAENGQLHVVPGATLDDGGTPFPPGTAPVRHGKSPMLVLAIDAPAGVDLSRLGIHVETAPLAGPAELALSRSPWYLLDGDGIAREDGTMLSRGGRGGGRVLYFTNEAPPPAEPGVDSSAAINVHVGEGPFGPQTFLFPTEGEALGRRGAPPPDLRESITRLVPEEFTHVLRAPLYWVAVPLPMGLAGVSDAFQAVTLNAVTASNIEILSELLHFERRGYVVEVRPEGQRGRHLLGVQSVLGETNARYRHEGDVDAPPGSGRYRIDRGRVHVQPAQSATGRLDRQADLRLLVTDGERGNGIDAGRIARIAGSYDNPLLQVANLTPTRGGANPPEYEQGRLRLAEALRSRERAVTHADFEVLVQAMEPRVKQTRVTYEAAVVDSRVQPVHRVALVVSRRDFGDPDTEIRRLRDTVERHLQARVLLGHAIEVGMEILP